MISTEEIESNKPLSVHEQVSYFTELLDELDNLIRVTERKLRALRRTDPIKYEWTYTDEMLLKNDSPRKYSTYNTLTFDDKGNCLPLTLKE